MLYVHKHLLQSCRISVDRALQCQNFIAIVHTYVVQATKAQITCLRTKICRGRIV